jgi:hypothetical protein
MKVVEIKPTADYRLHGNSVEPVYRAVKTLAARQVFRGESGKMQDLLNYVMVALTQGKRLELCDQLYDEGKKIFEETIITGKLPKNCQVSMPDSRK